MSVRSEIERCEPQRNDGLIRVAFKGSVGAFVLDAAFESPARGVTALFGPSGCGKTTMLRCMAGLLRLTGSCVVDGEVWQDPRGGFVPTYKRALGYVFQEASLFPHLSVRRNLLFGAPKHGGAKNAGVIGFEEAVDLLGVRALLDRSPRNLSGGERQRVAIGRALLSQPRLLLMDEPLSALDRDARSEILPLLERLRDTLSLPVVYVSHDLAEVERLADTIVLLRKGRVIASGPLAELQSDPALPLAVVRDAAVSLAGVAETYDPAYGLLTLSVRGGRFVIPAPATQAGERRRVRLLAGDVSLARERPAASSILNVLPVRIVTHALAGDNEVVAQIALGRDGAGERLLSRLTRKSWDELGLADGAIVFAQVKAVALAPERGEPPGGSR